MVHVRVHGSGVVHDVAFLAIPVRCIVKLRERGRERKYGLYIPVRNVLFVVEL